MKMSRLLCLALALLLSLSLCGCAAAEDAALSVYFFSAGKADAILLSTENASVLIDCGEKGFGSTILSYLEERGIETLDCLIVTHFDQDHVGGAAKVIHNIKIGSVLQSNSPKDSEEYEKYLKALGDAGLEPVTVREEYRFTLDGVEFTVNPPLLDDYRKDDSNNSSLIVTVKYGETVLLFMGDAQTERLAEYLAASPVDCDLLKIPHHGGEDTQMARLIAETAPEYAIITCSAEEPDTTATLRALDAAGVPVYLTSEGAVLVVSDGTTLTVSYVK